MPESPPALTIVVPVCNERENLAPLVRETRAALAGRRYELIFVDDGSTDGSLGELARLRSECPELRVMALAGHAGQSAALAAGWEAARGATVVTMDADGQNDPADIPILLRALDGPPPADAATGYRVRRSDSTWRILQSRLANAVRNGLTGDRIRDTGCALKAMRRDALMALPRFDGMHRFLPTLLRREGRAVVEVPVRHRRRRSGRSKYGAWNRAWRALRDAAGVRWLRRRALRYTIWEDQR